jgi:hypothetical protein
MHVLEIIVVHLLICRAASIYCRIGDRHIKRALRSYKIRNLCVRASAGGAGIASILSAVSTVKYITAK